MMSGRKAACTDRIAAPNKQPMPTQLRAYVAGCAYGAMTEAVHNLLVLQ